MVSRKGQICCVYNMCIQFNDRRGHKRLRMTGQKPFKTKAKNTEELACVHFKAVCVCP